jgi:acyl-CoA reductase-like NAD-dependent aldehyde dehydrogenase
MSPAAPDSVIPLLIKNSPTTTPKTFPVTCASSGTVVHHYSSASTTDASQACTSSATAFKTWRTTPHTQRRDLILRVADYFASHESSFIASQVAETSCTTAWARQNVLGSISYIREIAAQVSSVSGVIPLTEKSGTTGFVFKEPVGVVLCIAPWNAALILAVRGIASAIAVGCGVVFKASELCPATHSLITRAFIESGVPAGVLNQIQCRREDASEVTEALIKHEAIRKVEFIGSAAVGRHIGVLAAKYLKPVVLELGGKCPALVLEDADLAEAAKQCALGAVMNHGQICFSTERVIVLDAVAKEFQEFLVKEMKELSEKEVQGFAVSKDIAAHAADVVRDAQGKCEAVLLGGDDDDTISLHPTIILNPLPCARIFDE